MSERPTPETDKAKCKFTSLFGDDEDAYWVPLKVARRLERELEAERALADQLADALVATLRGNLAKMEIPIHLTRSRQRFRTILMEGGTQ